MKTLARALQTLRSQSSSAFGAFGKYRTLLVFVFSFALVAVAVPVAAHADAGADVGSCFSDFGHCLQNLGIGAVLGPVAIISYLLLALSNFLFWIVAAIFNWAVVKLVFEFGTVIGNQQGMLVAWSVLRDFGNLFLLFGFIFMGIGTILNIQNFSAKKALPALIIYAVLLNFSLFTAEAVIDTTNLLASSVYKASCAQGDNCSNSIFNINVGLAGAIIQQSGIGGVFGGFGSAANIQQASASVSIGDYFSDPVKTTAFFFGLALFVITATAVFGAGAYFLISRAIVLAFLMVTSPVGFAGMAIPPLHDLAKKWWNELLCQSFFAPIFLLLIFISLKVTEHLGDAFGAGGNINIADAIRNQSVAATGVFIVFAVVIGFLIGALLFARQSACILGAKVVVDNAFKFIGGTAGNATFGAYGFLGRRTIGAASNAGARAIRRSSIGATDTGRLLAGIVGAGANRSFDGRGIKGVPDFMGSASKSAKGGIAGIIKDQVEKKDKYDEQLGADDAEHYKNLELEQRRLLSLGRTADAAKVKAQMDATIAGQRATNKANLDAATKLGEEIAELNKNIKEAHDRGDVPEENRLTRERSGKSADLAALNVTIRRMNDAIKEQEGRYAEDLEKTSRFLRKFNITSKALNESIIKIRKRQGEDPKDKLLKTLDDLLKKGGAAPAPAPAPGTTTP